MRIRVLIVPAVLAFTLSPAAAGATSQNVASTHTYLVASYQALNAAVTTWPSIEASVHRLDQRVKSECADIGAGSPQNEEEQNFGYEVAGALWATGYHTDAAIIRPYIQTLKRLTWSKPQITRDDRRLAKGLEELLALQVPDICADVRAWRNDGFGPVPAGVVSYGQHAEAIEIKEIPRSLLDPYLQPSDRSLRARAERVATRFEELEFTRGQTDWLTLLEIVGLGG
jgi:hypothetical protein